MGQLSYFHKLLRNRIKLHWAAHYSRVTGKPSSSGYSFTIFDSIEKIDSSDWNRLNTANDIFLSSAYLKALELAPPSNMSFRYAIINKGKETIGIAYFQILAINYRLHQSPLKQLCRPETDSLFQKIHDNIITAAGTHLLVCGNALISGEHGFSIPAVSNKESLHVISEIMYTIRKTTNPRITAILIKDFYLDNGLYEDSLSRFGYHSFNAGPNMVIPVRDQWTSFENYINEMKPKYRKRTISAIKKGSNIVRQSMTVDDMQLHRETIFKLYCQVFKNANFRLFSLSPDFFISLKMNLGENFDCTGYFLGSNLIVFTTRIINNKVLEGYTHGLNSDYNKVFELYQNFLLDDIKAAIDSKSIFINTGRTSIAMKSSVGAIQKEMKCYIRFSGSHSNQLIRPLFSLIKPSNEHCRNPFED